MIKPQVGSLRRVLLLATLLLTLLGVGSAPPDTGQIPELSERINGFTLDWLKRCALAGQGTSNLVASPQSLFHGLAMSYIASGGSTRAELAQVVHFPDHDEPLMKQLSDLRRELHAGAGQGKKLDVRLANSAWLDSTYAVFQKNYLANLREAFKAPLHAVRFRDAPKVADEINQWVSENTRGRIAKAVSPEDFKSRSGPGVIEEPALVTMNAVYFKADWASKFIKSSTLPRSFQLDASSSKNTLMMHQNSLLPYSENAQLKFLELPYVDSRFSLYILLPKEILAVPRLMDLVSAEVVAGLKREACVHQVDVLFPKFEMVSHENVKSALAGMGVTSAFNRDKANFDRMITKRFEADRIYLSEVFSDAWIEVHEEGTRAAAATTTTHFSAGCSQAPRPRPVNFHADHPFLFFIVHNQSRSILFAGWMAKPPA